MWIVFEKAGKNGWATIVPFYNIIVFLEIIGKPWWWLFLMCIPYLNLIWIIWAANLFVKRFGDNTWSTFYFLFLPFIYLPLLAFDKNAVYKIMLPQKVIEKKNNNAFIWVVSIIFIIIILTLPFHYLPDHLLVFPKENMTFSNTFIFKSDVDRIIERYNKASFFERNAMNNEPIVRKLKEKGIIIDKNSANSDEDNN